jgi:hypothetical protein
MHLHQHKRALKLADTTGAYQADDQELNEASNRGSPASLY